MRKKILVTLTFGFTLTLLTVFFVGDKSLIPNSYSVIQQRGFPIHFIEKTSLVNFRFIFRYFISDWIIWSIVCGSIWYLIEQFKNKRKIVLYVTLGLALWWLFLDIDRNNSCVAGFPIEFYVKCSGESNITDLFTFFGWLIDFTFWFIQSAFLVSIIDILNKNFIGKFRYVLAPILLTLMSFWYDTPCGGEFCILTGRGFPAPYYSNDQFIWISFSVDILVWMLVLYPLARWLKRKYINKAYGL